MGPHLAKSVSLKPACHGGELMESSHSAETHSPTSHRAAGSMLTHSDLPLQERHLNTQIYCPAYNVFQEILILPAQIYF